MIWSVYHSHQDYKEGGGGAGRGKKQERKRNEQHQPSEIPIHNQQGAMHSELYSISVITHKEK